MGMMLARTPTWVWGILVGLIVLGLIQSRTRSVPRAATLLPSLALAGYSLFGISKGFVVHPFAMAGWFAGFLGAMLALRPPVAAAFSGLRASPLARGKVAGSMLPLLLFMTIFIVNFALGVARSAAPALLEPVVIGFAAGFIVGGCSGLLFARGIRASAGIP